MSAKALAGFLFCSSIFGNSAPQATQQSRSRRREHLEARGAGGGDA
jgi:hypothetical protein